MDFRGGGYERSGGLGTAGGAASPPRGRPLDSPGDGPARRTTRSKAAEADPAGRRRRERVRGS